MQLTKAQIASLLVVGLTVSEMFGFSIDEESKNTLIHNLPELILGLAGISTVMSVRNSSNTQLNNIFNKKADA